MLPREVSMQSCKPLCAAIKSVGAIKPVVCLCSQQTLDSIMLATERYKFIIYYFAHDNFIAKGC